MDDACPDCGRPFATTAHEQAYPAWCNGRDSYGCLRARIRALEAVVEAADDLRAQLSAYIAHRCPELEAYDAAREKLRKVTYG